MNEKRLVLVTGGGGFLGRHIIDQLLDKDYEVVQFSRSRYSELEKKGVRQLQGDLQRFESVRAALLEAGKGKPLDAIIHVAASTDMWGPWEKFYTTNVLGTQHLLRLSLEMGIPRFVYTSSPSVVFGGDHLQGADESLTYPDRYLSFYAQSKSLAEKMVLEQNNGKTFCTLALRPHLIWGPGDTHLVPTLVERARSGKLKQIGAGKNLVDVIYVENAAKAHVQALERLEPGSPLCGQSYFLGQENPVNLWDFINSLLKIYGLDPIDRKVPSWLGYSLGYLCEKVYSTLGIYHKLPPMTRFVSLQMSKSHYFSHKKAQAHFNYAPHITIAEGLKRLKNYKDYLESK